MGLQPVHQVIPSTSTSSSLDQEDQGPDTTKADESNTLFGIRTILTDKPVQDTQMLLNDDQSDSKDIGNFLNNSSSIPDKQKYDLLISPYRPPPTYDFKKDVESNKRPFIHKWLNQYDWLAYSKLLKGSFCKYCVIFPPTVNHGSALGAFITKPFLKYRDFHTQAKNHVNSAWHQDSANRAGEVLLRSVVEEANSSKYFSVLADETADIAGHEQLSIGIRYVFEQNDKFTLKEEFLGFVKLDRLNADSIASSILQFLEKSGLNLDKLVGQGYDGCSTMSGESEVQVCKSTLCLTLAITKRRLEILSQRILSSGIYVQDRRGGKRPARNKTLWKPKIIDFIASIPSRESHYSREKVTNRRYLSEDLTVRKLYNAFLEKHRLDGTKPPVSRQWFNEIFKKEFSLAFGAPRVDTCPTCDQYKISIAASKTPVEKNEFELKRELHQRKAESAQKMMSQNIEDCKSPDSDVCVLSYDLQKQLYIPALTHTQMYYSRQFTCINPGIHFEDEGKGFMYLWDETAGKRGCNEIGKEIQKKWKNLKDCFARELAPQRKVKSGEPAKKRRKYIYFDLLLFLLPSMNDRPTSSNTAPIENTNDNIQEEDTPTQRPNLQDNHEDQLNTPTRRPKKTPQKISRPKALY
ncbi:unnamed protein product [Acanthoscelides obtectus]|uniref:MADF domain-containing protein n=1 Tax=Acanthoscelides obtectus TaxID=200917 RepID=A0A9P0P5N5_ACAOB|nr:unnamed protein product [Acanthoscelides obtectus]CAK1634210.1 Zinc finger MYM-type protein 1 [Acanthoscelides obtectus]